MKYFFRRLCCLIGWHDCIVSYYDARRNQFVQRCALCGKDIK